MAYRIEQDFITNWINKNKTASVDDKLFHEAFYQKFGGKRKETNFGPQPVRKAMAVLKYMYDSNMLDRGRISIGCNWQPGFPRWVYVYTNKNE